MSRPHTAARTPVEELPRGLIARVILATLMIATALGFTTYAIMYERMRTLRPSMRFPEQALPAPHAVANVREEVFRMPHPAPAMRERQRAQLESFGWIDRGRRIVHIPIEAAMDLVAASRGSAGGAP